MKVPDAIFNDIIMFIVFLNMWFFLPLASTNWINYTCLGVTLGHLASPQPLTVGLSPGLGKNVHVGNCLEGFQLTCGVPVVQPRGKTILGSSFTNTCN